MQQSAIMTSAVQVLVVDQSPESLELVSSLLRARGYQVTTTTDGPEGLARLRQDDFHLVLTDLTPAKMSGWELGRTIKRCAPWIPVALVTSWDLNISMEASPFDAMILKPFPFDYFHQVVESLVQRQQPGLRLAG